MAKVLITGSNGFIGSHLAEALLARGHEVTCLVRNTSRLERLRPLRVRLAYGDITERQLPVARFSLWAHLRALGQESRATLVGADGEDSIESRWAAA